MAALGQIKRFSFFLQVCQKYIFRSVPGLFLAIVLLFPNFDRYSLKSAGGAGGRVGVVGGFRNLNFMQFEALSPWSRAAQ